MSIEDTTTVDGMGIDKDTGEVVLMISDHLDWTDEKAHLQTLEGKLNAYLSFTGGGQLLEAMPNAAGRPLKIAVYCKFEPPQSATIVLRNVQEQLSANGIDFWWGALPDGH